jgi:hypothetical protein
VGRKKRILVQIRSIGTFGDGGFYFNIVIFIPPTSHSSGTDIGF